MKYSIICTKKLIKKIFCMLCTIFRKMDQKLKIRDRLLCMFNLGLSAAEACRKVNESLGQDAVSERTCQHWFQKFREEGDNIEDKPRSGRPPTLDPDVLRETTNLQPATSVRQLAVELHTSKTTVHRHLKKLDMSYRSGRTVAHELTAGQRQQRVDICRQLLQRHQQDNFLHRIVTCDETWVLYDNRHAENQWLPVGQIAQATPKCLWPKKQMACVWWGVSGIIHWELLPNNTTVNAEVYAEQLQRVYNKLRRPPFTTLSRRGIILQQDGAPPHRAQTTREKIEELGWELLPHPAYSPVPGLWEKTIANNGDYFEA
jgi:[histone H3]-lysine36 N-dimethyltransferase SETMAR